MNEQGSVLPAFTNYLPHSENAALPASRADAYYLLPVLTKDLCADFATTCIQSSLHCGNMLRTVRVEDKQGRLQGIDERAVRVQRDPPLCTPATAARLPR